ncbi:MULTISPECIES: hypothetical protein [Chryseobacterium]|uniref:Uncharacterized protein n=1 Tax=Chryseobacterium camelliae TaxID=1265445 RepID=A0ABU0TMD1_9FLAO|nr:MULTISPECIES: hypothetical protein [Chryseobacterium]MDT3407943.1 hypothetical protein [Pseudacidovorax intermedius]MDQ1098197.1 hypothetical protein [Chryseobacterium camelliae]MDQ1102127.1 hypothetical protein [Chryseobacterium sp. SORGH_AS_1048]MDR6085565.1 hypothetical protein [Chryseobacterium sp. SORGH_AS_0909]MDR6129927.1 hypothetical protein [Chryseobacterium sp. SORGH_AS_1175]
MQNIQDLKEKIFFESRNIIGILDKINHAAELASCQDLVNDLAERITLLNLLEKHVPYQAEEKEDFQPFMEEPTAYEPHEPVTEEEAIFNNEFNEIPEYENQAFNGVTEEEAIFNNQLNEIVEGELHETVVNFVEEHSQETQEGYQEAAPEESRNEGIISEETGSEHSDISGTSAFTNEPMEEEAVFNNQLNEIDGFENEFSDEDRAPDNDFEEEERIREGFDASGHEEEKKADMKAIIPSIFDTGIEEDEILIEENESELLSSSSTNMEQGEMVTETSSVDHMLSEIKNEHSEESPNEKENVLAEVNDRRKITDIFNPHAADHESVEHKPSDESFENLDAYQQEKKIRLAHIKGIKAVQSLFDDDHLHHKIPEDKPAGIKPDTGSILKTNIPTDFMEAEKSRPEFKLDLNDRIAFTKTLFAGSQTDLNEVIGNLNSFKTLEEAKEYLSDLYYERKWNKVDEYAQRLWILVENKFI